MTSSKKNTSTSDKTPSVLDTNVEAVQGEDFYQMVSEAAYYRAEKRNFAPGFELEDWAAAEAEINDVQKESEVA